MQLTATIGYTLIKMLFLLIAGAAATKAGILNEERCKVITELIISILLPALIISGFTGGFAEERLRNLLFSLFLAMTAQLLCIIISAALIRRKEGSPWRQERSIASFPNVGFIGVPLVQALYGEEGVLYIAMFTAIYNMSQWSYGDVLINGNFHKEGLLRAMKSPVMCASYIGIAIFFLRIKIPNVIAAPISALGACNIALPMLVIGSSLVRSDIKAVLKKPQSYYVLGLRLLIIPFVFILCLKLFPEVPDIVKVVMLIPTACPPAVATSIICLKHGQDDSYSSTLVSLGTLMSMATIPLIVLLYSLI